MLKKLLVFVLLTAMLIVSVPTQLPLVVAQENSPPAVGLRPDAPPYAVHGPYWVGARDVVVDADTDHPLNMTLWYPALNPDGLDESTAYPIWVKADLGLPADWEGYIAGHALMDAAPDAAGAPYPLVILSHGFGVDRQTYAYLTEHLASYGFVVIAPDHIEMWDPMLTAIGAATFTRPMDIQRVIAYADALAGPSGDMAGLFDINQMAVAGHSYGGYTALAAAGGLFDTAAFNARCLNTPPDQEFTLFCESIVPHEAEFATMAGLDALPEGFWPSWGDPRVKAVASMAGSPILQDAGLKQVTVPVLAMVGTLDTAGEGLLATRQIFDSVGSPQKALVTFAGAEHYIFQWQCKDVPSLVDVGFFPVCSDSVWDMDRTHDLVNHLTTAFLLATLKGDADAAAALSPDAVSFPGIEYQAQGF